MNKRRKFTVSYKTKVVLEALKERRTMKELCAKYELHSTQINKWKQHFLNNAVCVFEHPASSKSKDELELEKLYRVIGQQKVELDFLKKALS